MWVLQGCCWLWIHLVWNRVSVRPSTCYWRPWIMALSHRLKSDLFFEHFDYASPTLRLLGGWDGAAGCRMGRSSLWRQFSSLPMGNGMAMARQWPELHLDKVCSRGAWVLPAFFFSQTEYCCGVPTLISKVFVERARAQFKRTTLLCRYTHYVAISAKLSMYTNKFKN